MFVGTTLYFEKRFVSLKGEGEARKVDPFEIQVLKRDVVVNDSSL